MKYYSPTGRRNHGRPLKRLLDMSDRNGSTSGPTPLKIYDDDDNYFWFQTFAVIWMLYYFFWVITRSRNFTCRHFGIVCLFHLHGWCKQEEIVHTTYVVVRSWNSVPKHRHIKFRGRGITQKKGYNLHNDLLRQWFHRIKCKAVPLQEWSGPEGSRKLRFPNFMTTAQDGGKVVILTHRPPLSSGNTPGTHFC